MSTVLFVLCYIRYKDAQRAKFEIQRCTLDCNVKWNINWNVKCIFFFAFVCNFYCFLKWNLRSTFKCNIECLRKITFYWNVLYTPLYYRVHHHVHFTCNSVVTLSTPLISTSNAPSCASLYRSWSTPLHVLSDEQSVVSAIALTDAPSSSP